MTKEKQQQLAFGFLMSMQMALIMSGILTAVNTGLANGYLARWMHAFLIAWACAFPLVLLFAPLTRKLVSKLIK